VVVVPAEQVHEKPAEAEALALLGAMQAYPETPQVMAVTVKLCLLYLVGERMLVEVGAVVIVLMEVLLVQAGQGVVAQELIQTAVAALMEQSILVEEVVEALIFPPVKAVMAAVA
jgi:hypothetical protein